MQTVMFVLRFYCRRFIRLFPASATVLNVTALLFRFTELPKYVKMHQRSFIASALYFQNWHGLNVELDYFTDEGSDQSPVIHFWSLSIEEQFYAVFPILLVVITFICKKRISLLFLFFATCSIFCIFLNVKLSFSSHMVAYFSTWGRLYQFTLGSVISATILMIPKTGFLAEKLQNEAYQTFADFLSLGTLFCLCCMVTLVKGGSPMFLGIGTSLLTFAMILFLEISSQNNFIKSYVYHNPFLCFVGKLSYPMYLVHLPLTKIGDINSLLPEDAFFRPITVLLSTITLSFLVKKSIEEPVKNLCSKFSSKLILLVFLTLTVIQPFLLNQILRYSFDEPFSFSFITKENENQTIKINNQDPEHPNLCDYLADDISFLLVGDSYCLSWNDWFQELHSTCAVKADYESFCHNGSPFFSTYYWGTEHKQLTEKAKKIIQMIPRKSMEYILANKPNITIYFARQLHIAEIKVTENSTAMTATSNLNKWTEMIRSEIPKLIEKVIPFTTPVIMITHQTSKQNPTECIKKLENQHKDLSNFTNACPITISEESGVPFLRAFYQELSHKYPKFHYIDMASLFIGSNATRVTLPAIFEGVPVFRDGAHLSNLYVKKMLPVLLSELRRQRLL